MASVARAADPPIDIGSGYDRLADAFTGEHLQAVRKMRVGWQVELTDGRTATGFTIRGAISNARAAS